MPFSLFGPNIFLKIFLSKIGRYYGMEMSAEKTKVIRISRPPSSVQIMVDQKQLENVEYFIYLSSMITKDACCRCEIKSRTAKTQAAINKMTLYSTKLDSNLRKKLVKCDTWGTAVYGAENWTIGKLIRNT